jgi:hypothetical protein
MYWDKMDKEDRELDRQYYLSKIDELGRCLPVVKAARAFNAAMMDNGAASQEIRRLRVKLLDAVDVFEAAEKVKS